MFDRRPLTPVPSVAAATEGRFDSNLPRDRVRGWPGKRCNSYFVTAPNCLLLSAYCILLTAFCLLPTDFRLPVTYGCHARTRH
jgi:hypothetical protein